MRIQDGADTASCACHPDGKPPPVSEPGGRGAASPPRPVWRGIVVGSALVPLNTLWILYMERISGRGPLLTTMSLFLNVVFILALVILANDLVRRARPRWALNQGEIVIVYIMLAIGSAIAGLDNMQLLFVAMTHGFWFANPENRYEQLLASAPRWLVVSDRQVLYGYYNGGSSLYQELVLRAWLTPALWWLGFIVVMVFVMLCLSAILRRQWADHERLTFPIAQLPMHMSVGLKSLLRNRALWIGSGLAAAVDLTNGLAYLYPHLPYLPVGPIWGGRDAIDLMQYLPDLPWAAIGWLPVTFYPTMIGICFLLPLELLFSSVFFFFWWKAMFVVAAALGVSGGWAHEREAVFPWSTAQVLGGYVAIAMASLLTGRHHLAMVWQHFLGRGSSLNGRGEALSYRVALLGVVLGVVLLLAFAVRGGLSLGMSLLFFGLFLCLAVAVARVRAEFGYPVQDFHLSGPGQTITYVAGSASIRSQDLVMFSLLWWFNSCYRAHPIGITIDGVQLAHRTRSAARTLVLAVMVATTLTVLSVFWGLLHYAYQLGVASGFGGPVDPRHEEMMSTLQTWVQYPSHPNPGALAGIALGFVLTTLLAVCRTAFARWPLHPAAYVLAAGWSIHMLWLPMLIAWVAKWLVLRHGGLRLYREIGLPFFYGLILGETAVGCGWSLVGLILDTYTYSFWGL